MRPGTERCAAFLGVFVQIVTVLRRISSKTRHEFNESQLKYKLGTRDLEELQYLKRLFNEASPCSTCHSINCHTVTASSIGANRGRARAWNDTR